MICRNKENNEWMKLDDEKMKSIKKRAVRLKNKKKKCNKREEGKYSRG